tara:strand:+ start:309 stop:626 length:318 start_codon:yes stop_codon:yes gene_type:complete
MVHVVSHFVNFLRTVSTICTAWKPRYHWQSPSHGTWEIHRGNYSNTGEEYWAVKIRYSSTNNPWQYVIKLTDFKNSIKNIFYDKDPAGLGYGNQLWLTKGDLLVR